MPEIQSGRTDAERIHDLATQVDNLMPDLAVRLLNFVRDFPDKDVTVAQAFLIHRLYQGPYTASAIGEMLGITSGPVTSLTKRLVEKGIIERTRDEVDGRVVWFSLTGPGRQLAERLSHHSIARWSLVIAELGSDKAARIIEVMRETMTIVQQLTDNGN